jgi:hypothetical protein
MALSQSLRSKSFVYNALTELDGEGLRIAAASVADQHFRGANKHLTPALGYGHFGNVLSFEFDEPWVITTEWEF